MESLTKELTSAKLELEAEKERSISLALRLKDLEVQYAEAVNKIVEFFLFSQRFYLESRIK